VGGAWPGLDSSDPGLGHVAGLTVGSACMHWWAGLSCTQLAGSSTVVWPLPAVHVADQGRVSGGGWLGSLGRLGCMLGQGGGLPLRQATAASMHPAGTPPATRPVSCPRACPSTLATHSWCAATLAHWTAHPPWTPHDQLSPPEQPPPELQGTASSTSPCWSDLASHPHNPTVWGGVWMQGQVHATAAWLVDSSLLLKHYLKTQEWPLWLAGLLCGTARGQCLPLGLLGQLSVTRQEGAEGSGRHWGCLDSSPAQGRRAQRAVPATGAAWTAVQPKAGGGRGHWQRVGMVGILVVGTVRGCRPAVCSPTE
jgi:hypothetical protein